MRNPFLPNQSMIVYIYKIIWN